MAPRTKRGRHGTVTRVMREFKEGTLKGGRGRRGKVKNRKQAIAIALTEAGVSRKQRSKRRRPR
jgi:Family of unknown function (DUF6496)